MSNLIDVFVKVPEEFIQDGHLELVRRQVHQKIKAMTKVMISGSEGAADQTTVRVIQAMGHALNEASEGEAGLIRAGLRTLQSRAGEVSSQIIGISKQLSAKGACLEKILEKAGQLKNLSYLGIGLQLANIAIDVIGFVVIAKRINVIDEKVRTLAAKVDQIHYMLKAEKIAEFQKLVMRFNAMTTKITDHDEFSRDILETLLIDIRTFISEMVHDFNYGAMDASLILEIIFDLLTAYSALLCVFLREYYFEKHRLPDNYAMFIGVYQDLVSNEFLASVRNYLFLEKRLSSRETMDAINAQNILTLNNLMQISDQVDLLELARTRERYLELMHGVFESAEASIRANLSRIAEETKVSAEECESVLARALAACGAAN